MKEKTKEKKDENQIAKSIIDEIIEETEGKNEKLEVTVLPKNKKADYSNQPSCFG